MPAAFAIDAEAVAQFCRHHFIAEPAMFGSVLRNDFSDHRDVDVLVVISIYCIIAIYCYNQSVCGSDQMNFPRIVWDDGVDGNVGHIARDRL